MKQITLPHSVEERRGHSFVMLGVGSDFRVAVLFGGKKVWNGDLLSGTMLLFFGND